MSIFDTPDFAKLKRDGEMARLIHWANYVKDPQASRAAMAVVKSDVYDIVEHLYETAMWTQKNSARGGRRLPRRGVSQLHDAALALRRIGAEAVDPLVDSVRTYESYGDMEIKARLLYLSLVFDILEKIGRPAADGLRRLARERDPDARKQARDALEALRAHGLIDKL